MSRARASPERQRSTRTISGSEARADAGIGRILPANAMFKPAGARNFGLTERYTQVRPNRMIETRRPGASPVARFRKRENFMIPLLLILLILALAFGGFFVFSLKVAIVDALV